MTKTDWKEMLIELEIMPKWIPKMMNGRYYTEHRVDGKTKLYDRSGYLIELERNVFFFDVLGKSKLENPQVGKFNISSIWNPFCLSILV